MYEEYIRSFMARHYPDKHYPTWVVEALQAAGCDLLESDGVPDEEAKAYFETTLRAERELGNAEQQPKMEE